MHEQLNVCTYHLNSFYIIAEKIVILLKICIIVSGLYVLSFGVLGRRTEEENNHSEISFLDKFQQHDYKFDFERLEMLHYDERYLKECHVVTFKYNRTCTLANITAEYNIDIGNNLEIIAQLYKFASNEYRLFPVRFQMNFCQAISKNIAGYRDFLKCENFTGCPLLKGKSFKTCNWKPNPEKFPPFVPNGQYMVEFQAMYQSTELWTMRAYGTISRPIAIPKK